MKEDFYVTEIVGFEYKNQPFGDKYQIITKNRKIGL